MSSNIEERVKMLIALHFAVDAESLVRENSFIDDLGGDQVDVMEIVMAIEKEFDVNIPESEAVKMTTVKAAIDYANSLY